MAQPWNMWNPAGMTGPGYYPPAPHTGMPPVPDVHRYSPYPTPGKGLIHTSHITMHAAQLLKL